MRLLKLFKRGKRGKEKDPTGSNPACSNPECFGRHYSYNRETPPEKCCKCMYEERCKLEGEIL